MDNVETTAAQAVVADAAQAAAEPVTETEWVRKLRDEAARYRVQNKELVQRLEAAEEERRRDGERLVEQEKAAQAARAQVEQATADLRASRAQAAVAMIAAKRSIDPVLLGKLVVVEFDDDGNPKGVEESADAVLKEYPQLRATTAPSATNPSRGGGGKLTLDDVRRMTPEQINARWEDVQAAMQAAGGK